MIRIFVSLFRSYYDFNKVSKDLSESGPPKALEHLFQYKGFIIQKAEKGNTGVITDHTR